MDAGRANVRIALHASGEIGTRTGRILLAERDLTALGLYGHDRPSAERKTMAISSLEGFDVFVTDDAADAASFARIAAEESVACVLAADPDLDDDVLGAFEERPLVVGADLPAIARALASHEAARSESDLDVLVAWTEPGSPVRSGEAIPFPDPVGARWGKKQRGGGVASVVCPVDDEWHGAMARVTGADASGVHTRVVGVADHGPHLRAIALAAAAIAVAEGAFGPGRHHPADRAEAYLAAALRIGMDVAAFTAG